MHTVNTSLSYDLPWNTAPCYWLAIWSDTPLSKPFINALKTIDHCTEHTQGFLFPLVQQWTQQWRDIESIIRTKAPAVGLHTALIPGEDIPDTATLERHALDVSSINRIAQNLWLGDALLQNRLHSYLQPVIDVRGNLYAHEAFARMVDDHDQLVDGATLFQASRNLGVEETLDQHLHQQAIQAYDVTNFRGHLFINMLPGLIQKPEKYLAGLAHSLAASSLTPEQIVLDISSNAMTYTPQQIQLIHHYAHEHGYATALDDVMSAKSVVETLRFAMPDYLKIDIRLVQQSHEPAVAAEIADIVDIARKSSLSVLAEGIENEQQHQMLKQLGADFFQGYLFGRPQPAEKLLLTQKAG